MPEGPEIRRVADKLEAAIVGQPLTEAWFAFPQLKTYEPSLIGEQVQAIETRGKALLTHFSNGLTLYSHNQLYGIWRIVKPDTIKLVMTVECQAIAEMRQQRFAPRLDRLHLLTNQ